MRTKITASSERGSAAVSADGKAYFPENWLDGQRKFVGKFLCMANIRYFRSGEPIDSPQGEPMKALHVVLDGVVECSFQNADQKRVVWIVKNGMFIGMSSLDGYLGHHTFSCRTSAIVASMPAEDISKWSHDMFLALAEMQTRKAYTAANQVNAQYLEPAHMKVARLLLELSRSTGSGGAQDIPLIVHITKQGIAEQVGISREHATKIIGAMQRSGLLVSQNRDIIFVPSKLREVIDRQS